MNGASSSLAIAKLASIPCYYKRLLLLKVLECWVIRLTLFSFFSALPDTWASKELLDHGEVVLEISRLNSNAYQISEINFLNNDLTLRRPCLMRQRFRRGEWTWRQELSPCYLLMLAMTHEFREWYIWRCSQKLHLKKLKTRE